MNEVKNKLMKRERKGFTLMEMLIVVAIIAVLVAIAIPVFMGQLEKAREATDLANIRAAYAEVSAVAITGDKGTRTDISETTSGTTKTYSMDVKLGQSGEWETEAEIAGYKAKGGTGDTALPTGGTNSTVTVSVGTDGSVKIANKS